MTPNTTAVTGGDAFVHGLRGNTTNLTQDGINVQDNTVKTSAFFALSLAGGGYHWRVQRHGGRRRRGRRIRIGAGLHGHPARLE